jgi:2-dehydro-3-deoxygluconokinase
MAQNVIRDFPGLKVLATTMRRVHSASSNDWGAFAYANGAVAEGIRYNNLEIFDRVGGGDSFASGLIYGLLMGRDLKWSLDCGVAHGALAMLTPGDSSMATLAEVEGLMAGDGAGVKR